MVLFIDGRKSRAEATISCSTDQIIECAPLESPCLFDIINDPCEETNLAWKFPNILKTMMIRLAEYNATAIEPGNLPIDERGNPIHHNHVWTNFGDYI